MMLLIRRGGPYLGDRLCFPDKGLAIAAILVLTALLIIAGSFAFTQFTRTEAHLDHRHWAAGGTNCNPYSTPLYAMIRAATGLGYSARGHEIW